MRFAICLLVMLAVLAIGQVTFNVGGHAGKARAATRQSEDGPKILNVGVQKKKLIVTGEKFARGAVILVNGEPQKTTNDEDDPTFRLIAKKAAKKMPSDAIASITVKNPDGKASDEFNFFKGLTITLDDGGKTINLEVGDKFLLILNRSPYKWEATVQNPAIVKLVEDGLPVMGAIGIYEAIGKGQTDLTAIGNLPCYYLNPPCLAPSLQFQVHLNVQ